MNTKTFSIIIPVYKVEKYLSKCVDSILDQTFENYEVILVDDGSPDDCPKLCDEYALKSEKIRVIHKSNGGLSDARNVGVAAAEGIYTTFVDSDDFWIGNDILSKVFTIIEKYNYPDVIVSDFIKYFEPSDKYLKPSLTCPIELNGKSKQEIIEYLYFNQADMKMAAWQKFVRKDILSGISFEKGLLSEDIDWSLKVYTHTKTIAVIPRPYYCYRQQREGSITNTASFRSFNSLMHILDKWEPEIMKLEIAEEEKEIYLGYLCYQLTISMALYCKLNDNEKDEALRKIIGHKHLFSYKLNRKAKSVKRLVGVLGVRNTCTALKVYIKLRSLLKLG